MLKRTRTESTDSMTSKLDEIFRVNALRLKTNWAASTTRNEHLSSLFPDESWDTKTSIQKSFDKAEGNMDRSITPQQIDDVLSDVVMLRHRLASSTEAEFIHTSTVRADTVKYNGQLKTLMACHTTVRQAASIADEMAAAVSISPNIDTHSQFTIATIIDEIDEMQRYLCEDVGDFYLCHIRPALLSPSLPCPCDRCVKNRENNPVHGIPPHGDDE
jgi:hypothetical protein